MADFEPQPQSAYKLLPFNFTRLAGDEYVLTNVVGEFMVIGRDSLDGLIKHKLDPKTPIYSELKSRHFLVDEDSDVAFDLLALKTRSRLLSLSQFTSLHIFVVTLRCEHSCPYCQVSRQSDDKLAFDMSIKTAEKSLSLVFKSPSSAIKIEFQGGESLLNFELIRYIVLRAKEINELEMRNLQFVIATNLAVITDEILSFCKEHEILISTSLDGPRDLHNKNRPRPGRNSYEKTVEGIRRVREALGNDRVSALMTTTEASLPRIREVIDEYVALGFDSIFLRSLSPYGFAIKTQSYKAYGTGEWFDFFREGLDYIIQLNRRGVPFVEQYSAIILKKMMTPLNPGYVDLANPSGIGIAVLVYNYDGDVYASDEGRMLAEMGDKTFRLGNVHVDEYERILLSEKLLDPIEESFSSSAPMCSDCAFEPFCGAEPVYHHATQGDYVGKKPTSGFCGRNMAIFRHLITLMQRDPDIKNLFRRWAFH